MQIHVDKPVSEIKEIFRFISPMKHECFDWKLGIFTRYLLQMILRVTWKSKPATSWATDELRLPPALSPATPTLLAAVPPIDRHDYKQMTWCLKWTRTLCRDRPNCGFNVCLWSSDTQRCDIPTVVLFFTAHSATVWASSNGAGNRNSGHSLYSTFTIIHLAPL